MSTAMAMTRLGQVRRPRSIGIALAAVVAIVAIVGLGALVSLLPRTGLNCPHPGARVMLEVSKDLATVTQGPARSGPPPQQPAA